MQRGLDFDKFKGGKGGKSGKSNNWARGATE